MTYLKLDEILCRYRLGESTWYKWVAKGKAPAPVKFGRASRWKMGDLLEWEASREQAA